MKPISEQNLSVPEDTDRLKAAIEKVADEETAALPHQKNLSDALNADILKDRKKPEDDTTLRAAVSDWFFTFMCMNIPIVGWFYLFYLAFNKKQTGRRNFARAYLFYKFVFLSISLLILAILIYIGLGMLDKLLAYMQML